MAALAASDAPDRVLPRGVARGIEAILAALAEAGLTPRLQVSAYRALVAMCFGFVVAQTHGFQMSRAEVGAFWSSFAPDPSWNLAVPHVLRIAPEVAQVPAEADFRFMLDAYLAAVKRSLEAPPDSAGQDNRS